MKTIETNEMVAETFEEVATMAGSNKALQAVKVAGGVGAVCVVGTVLYKTVGKPLVAKIKAKKNKDNVPTEVELDSEENCVEETK